MENVITFPALGISVTVNRVAFNVFGKDIYWYGVIIALGFTLAVLYCSLRIRRFGFNNDLLFDALVAALPSAIVGARLYYVIWEWGYYSKYGPASRACSTWPRSACSSASALAAGATS